MRHVVIARRLFGIAISLFTVVLSAPTAQTGSGPVVNVSIAAVSGDAGHAFVFAQVSDANSTYPAPTGTSHLSRYFSEWVQEPLTTSLCPWFWAVYVFDRVTGIQVNPPPPDAPLPNFGTTTMVCASPTTTPVGVPAVVNAWAQLDLDLQVTVSPQPTVAGSPTQVSAVLSSALSQDLDLYLSMAIEDWSVKKWAVAFGDGQKLALSGDLGTAIQVSHSYGSVGTYDAGVTAAIAGHAEAAVYDRFGSVELIRRPFSVDIANHVLATARSLPVHRYAPPNALVTVAPTLGPTVGDAGAPAFRHIDALRGSITTLVVHLLIVHEGQLTIDGKWRGFGRSRLTGWRLEGSPSDAPSGTGTTPGMVHPPGDPLRLQWNAPDRISGTHAQDYTVPLTLYVETRFPDGHVAAYAIASSFSVSVGFAAESG
ncbi:MAG TPA: hypothetical protein VM674_06920 [Candidatus Acidoferrum sp.]|nr:hypothetical protein [Candidatus Acidoferrum sp.]